MKIAPKLVGNAGENFTSASVKWYDESGSSLTSVGYTGQRLDGGSGLMYYGARYYDPVLSMFVSPDPTTPYAKNPMDYEKYLYTRGNPLRFSDSTGFGPEDYYVFVSGCVSNPWDCSKTPSFESFGGYAQLLKSMYMEGNWGDPADFGQWANEHVKTLSVNDLQTGAEQIQGIISGLPKWDSSDIHLFGTSMGGAAIMQYLAYATTTEDIARRRSAYGLSNSPAVRPGGAEIDYELDYRIASVTTVDSPLNQVDDREAIGQLLAKYTRVKTTWSDVGESQETALTVDGSDLVNHVPINNIRKDPNETWSGPCMPCWPHSQHTTQVGNDTRAFLERVWK